MPALRAFALALGLVLLLAKAALLEDAEADRKDKKR